MVILDPLQTALLNKQLLGKVTPLDAHIGLNIRGQKLGHSHFLWLFSIGTLFPSFLAKHWAFPNSPLSLLVFFFSILRLNTNQLIVVLELKIYTGN